MKRDALAGVVAHGWGTQGFSPFVWDRARAWRHGVCALPVHRIEQPAYSLELNPAEWVCEWLRSRIEGTMYGTIEAKREAVEQELCELNASADRIQRLTGWVWIREALVGLSE